jgi:hypothetical protein
MKTTKVPVALTESQLADIITCISHGIDRGLGYGHVTRQEEALHEANRIRLHAKLTGIMANWPSVHTRIR